MLIGVLSDTHGEIRPEALRALRGAQRILHAGDVGSAHVLAALAAIAPVVAVRGNNDRGAWARRLPASVIAMVGGKRIHVVHDRNDLALDLGAAKIDVVICGHSHRPGIEEHDGVLFLNPGSAGPRRFRLPVCVARLRLGRGRPRVEIVPLDGELS